jgi:hypothetical protein
MNADQSQIKTELDRSCFRVRINSARAVLASHAHINSTQFSLSAFIRVIRVIRVIRGYIPAFLSCNPWPPYAA